MSDTPTPANEDDARWAEKKRKQKAARDRMLATKTRKKGLLMVHTGKGKGKTTAAMGLAMRAIGNGMKVGIVQFVKGKWETGERHVLRPFRTMWKSVSWAKAFPGIPRTASAISPQRRLRGRWRKR